MKIRIVRRGGFAGMTVSHELDTASLAPEARHAVEELARKAIANPPGPERSRIPDAFEYEIAIDGRRYVVGDDDPAWRALIERVAVQ